MQPLLQLNFIYLKFSKFLEKIIANPLPKLAIKALDELVKTYFPPKKAEPLPVFIYASI